MTSTRIIEPTAASCRLRAEALLARLPQPRSEDALLFATLIAARDIRNDIASLGLPHEALIALCRRHFDGAMPALPLAGIQVSILVDDEHATFVDTLYRLLLTRRHASVNPDDADYLAIIVAHACLRPDHLWRDLGLTSRDDVTRMLTRFFPLIVAGNVNNLRWKKFLAFEVARERGREPGPAPGCPGCEDFGVCFQPGRRRQ